MTDEHFIVWMRSAGLPNFRKLWGKISNGLDSGNYVLQVQNEFVVSSFGGSKTFFLSTTNSMGGKNTILMQAYILAGVSCLCIAIGFCLVESKDRRDIQTAKNLTNKLSHLLAR